MSIQVFCPFLNWIVCFCCYWGAEFVYMFWISSTYHVIYKYFHSFGRLFSPSWRCPLMHESFKFWWSPVYLFFLVTCALPVMSKNLLPNSMSYRFTLMLSFKSLIVLALTFRLLFYSELMFMCNVIQVSNFIHLLVEIWLSQYTTFPSLNGLGTIVKNQLAIDVWVYFWTFNSFPLVIHLFLGQNHTVLNFFVTIDLHCLKSEPMSPPAWHWR